MNNHKPNPFGHPTDPYWLAEIFVEGRLLYWTPDPQRTREDAVWEAKNKIETLPPEHQGSARYHVFRVFPR